MRKLLAHWAKLSISQRITLMMLIVQIVDLLK